MATDATEDNIEFYPCAVGYSWVCGQYADPAQWGQWASAGYGTLFAYESECGWYGDTNAAALFWAAV
jgi:hypothetical protein